MMRRYIAVWLTLGSLLGLVQPALGQPPEMLWSRTFGGFESDFGTFVQQTSDSGFIVTGWTASFGAGQEDIFLLKTTPEGDSTWMVTYGDWGYDYGTCVRQTNDGGYIITGYWYNGSNSADLCLIRVDSLGNVLWSRIYGGGSADWGDSVIQTDDGGFMAVGTTWSYGAGSKDFYLVKTDTDGNLIWSNTFGGSSWELAHDVLQTADGGYMIVGEGYSYAGSGSDIYLLKTDEQGDSLWLRTYGGWGWESGNDIEETADGGYIIAGTSGSISSFFSYAYVVKTDALGDTAWTRVFGGEGDVEGYEILQRDDGSYVFNARAPSAHPRHTNLCVYGIDEQGDSLWAQLYPGNFETLYSTIARTDDDGIIVTGTYANDFGDIWLMRLGDDISSVPAGEPAGIVDNATLAIYPNPFNPSTVLSYQMQVAGHVNLAVYNVHGRKVADLVDGWRGAGTYEVTFDGSNLPSGLYFYRLMAGEFSDLGKMVLMK